MVEINILEQTPILRFKTVFDNRQCVTISQEILDYKNSCDIKSDANMQLNANQGCWMGMPHKHGGFSKEIEFLLMEKILSCCNEYAKNLKKPNNINNLNTDYLDKSQFHVHAWCNVNDINSENYIHSHPGNFASGVIWFQAEGTGVLEFIPHNYINKLTHPVWPYHGVSRYKPVDGDILIFPSYLLHRVERNTSNQQRVSMAFDLSFSEK